MGGEEVGQRLKGGQGVSRAELRVGWMKGVGEVVLCTAK